MTPFEFLMGLYGLVLGLAFANVATGFADVLRSRNDITVGWCIPLLAVYMILATTGVWLTIWPGRETVEVEPIRVLLTLASYLPLVFLSRAMFPQTNDGWSSLEDYYFAHRRLIVGTVLIMRLLGEVSLLMSVFVLKVEWTGWSATLPGYAYTAARIVLLTAMFLNDSVWLHRFGWAMIIVGVIVAVIV